MEFADDIEAQDAFRKKHSEHLLSAYVDSAGEYIIGHTRPGSAEAIVLEMTIARTLIEAGAVIMGEICRISTNESLTISRRLLSEYQEIATRNNPPKSGA